MTEDRARRQEADLVKRAREGDAVVWSHWYDSYYRPLFRYAFARLGHQDAAENAVAQTFLEALKRIDEFNHKNRPVLAWLYSFLNSLVSQRLSSRGAGRKDPPGNVDEDSPAPEPVSDQAPILTALSYLNADQQNVIILRFFLSMSIEETARVLQKKDNAVRNLQVHAVAAMRRRLGDDTSQTMLGQDA